MDKIDKFTRRLRRDEALKLSNVINLVRSNQLSGLDIKKLKGGNSVYRVRIGRTRIHFLKTDQGNVIVKVGFRNDNTYS